MLKSINPYENVLINEYYPYSDNKVKNIIDDADKEFQNWKTKFL